MTHVWWVIMNLVCQWSKRASRFSVAWTNFWIFRQMPKCKSKWTTNCYRTRQTTNPYIPKSRQFLIKNTVKTSLNRLENQLIPVRTHGYTPGTGYNQFLPDRTSLILKKHQKSSPWKLFFYSIWKFYQLIVSSWFKDYES